MSGSPHSSQNTTLRIFDNSTTVQQTALASLLNDLRGSDLTDAEKITKFETYVTTVRAGSNPNFNTEISMTGVATTAAAQVDGYYSGTFTKAISGTTFAGSYISVGTSSGKAMLKLTVESVTGTTPTYPVTVAADAFTTGLSASVTNSSTWSGTITATTASSITAGSNPYELIDGITAYNATGETEATISAKLLNRKGTYKDKGSTDGGDWGFDFLDIPDDVGQILLRNAKADKGLYANRVFVKESTNTDDATNVIRWFGICLVTKVEDSDPIDSMVMSKATCPVQDGQVRGSSSSTLFD
jgi:hypothetical protein